MSDTDTAFVDLIEEQFPTFDDYRARFLAEADDLDAGSSARYDDAYIKTLYDEDLAAFQPWRIEICAHNGEPLFRSTERYRDERDARRAIEIALGPNVNVWLRQEGKEQVAVRVAWRD